MSLRRVQVGFFLLRQREPKPSEAQTWTKFEREESSSELKTFPILLFLLLFLLFLYFIISSISKSFLEIV